jgi:hypothetical protein
MYQRQYCQTIQSHLISSYLASIKNDQDEVQYYAMCCSSISVDVMLSSLLSSSSIYSTILYFPSFSSFLFIYLLSSPSSLPHPSLFLPRTLVRSPLPSLVPLPLSHHSSLLPLTHPLSHIIPCLVLSYLALSSFPFSLTSLYP